MLEFIVGVNYMDQNYIIVGEAIINDMITFIITIVNIQLFQSYIMNPWYWHFCKFRILPVVILTSILKCSTIFVKQLAMCESFGKNLSIFLENNE